MSEHIITHYSYTLPLCHSLQKHMRPNHMNPQVIEFKLNVIVGWLALLLHIWEVPD